MQQAIQINVKELAIAASLAMQLAPSNLWGEALHTSGLFAYLVKSLQEDTVGDDSLVIVRVADIFVWIARR
jgi:hypothetical protein